MELYSPTTVCKQLNLQLVLYQARHSGASRDAAEHRRSRQEILKRGGWRCVRSVNRYETGGRTENSSEERKGFAPNFGVLTKTKND